MLFQAIIPLAPVAKGRPRFTRTGHAYTPKKTRDAEELLRWHLLRLWRGRAVITGAVTLRITFVMPLPNGVGKKKLAELKGAPHLKRPDKDNLEKMVMDCMNGIVLEDDSQIWRSEVQKVYGSPARIDLTIES